MGSRAEPCRINRAVVELRPATEKTPAAAPMGASAVKVPGQKSRLNNVVNNLSELVRSKIEVKMRILVACEESQRVCLAFRAKGHEAYSCDIEFCSGGAPQWHIWEDVSPLLNGGEFLTCDGQSHTVERWDMIIAFPPCTYLSKAGSCNLIRNGEINEERLKLGQQAAEFFMKIYNADCDKICIENPVPMRMFGLPEPTQVVEPYMFGVPVSKTTYLWLKGLRRVCPTNVIKPQYTFNTYPQFKSSFGKYRQKNRSKTFEEFAAAMALSWG